MEEDEIPQELIDLSIKQALRKTDVSGSGFTRHEMGESWMWCSDCMSKLYSFDGNEDSARKCPHPQKCADDRIRLSNHCR